MIHKSNFLCLKENLDILQKHFPTKRKIELSFFKSESLRPNGLCNFKTQRISINKKFFQLGNIRKLLAILIHEYAHALQVEHKVFSEEQFAMYHEFYYEIEREANSQMKYLRKVLTVNISQEVNNWLANYKRIFNDKKR